MNENELVSSLRYISWSIWDVYGAAEGVKEKCGSSHGKSTIIWDILWTRIKNNAKLFAYTGCLRKHATHSQVNNSFVLSKTA